jgi:hypothetical protein
MKKVELQLLFIGKRDKAVATGRPEYFLSIRPIFLKVAKAVFKPKNLKICTPKLNFGSPKHLHQTAYVALKYLQQTMFMKLPIWVKMQ